MTIFGTENQIKLPDVDLLTLLFDSPHSRSEEHTALHAEAADPLAVITKARVRILAQQIAHFLRHTYGIVASSSSSAQPSQQDVVVAVSTGQSALPCLFFGVLATTAIYSSASPADTPDRLSRQLRDGPARLLVCSADCAKLARAAAATVGLPERKLLVLRSRPHISLSSVDGAVVCDLSDRAPLLPWPALSDPRELRERTACLLYSSGTTGLPKGVLVTHANLVAETFLVTAANRPIYDEWERQGKAFPRRTLAHLPTAHIAGLLGYFLTPMFEGGIVYWMPGFKMDDFLRYIPELAITGFFSVPPIYAALAKLPTVTGQLAAIRLATAGAAPFSREMQQAVSDKIAPGAIVSQVWGLTETTGALTQTPLGRIDTIGSLSPLLPNVALKLVDDNDRDVAPGEPGEALVRGPMITKGYHNNPEANRNAFLPGGWLRTGDVLRIEKDLLYMVDRKKELIKYKGLQVAPAELEGVLLAHPAIADAAVIGVPWHGTEVPRAFVARAADARPPQLSEDDVVRYVKARVATHMQLRGGVVFVDAVPRSPSGKILRRQLRDRYLPPRQSHL